MRRIAVVGASCSGKTWLVTRLAQALRNLPLQIDDSPQVTGPALPHGEVLLMGLDLHHAGPSQLLEDQALRQALTQQQHPFHVIYGQGEERLTHALRALKATSMPSEAPAPPAKRKPWAWSCEKCSDPVCEHRLLSDLLAKR